MSNTQAIISLMKNLSEDERRIVMAEFTTLPLPSALPVPSALPAPVPSPLVKQKKPRAKSAATGKGTAWSAFCAKIMVEHKDQLNAVKADAAVRRKSAKDQGIPVPEDTKGAHLHWCGDYKVAHAEEWMTFKNIWELENKGNAEANAEATGVSSDAESSPAVGGGGTGAELTAHVPGKKRGPKKFADMTPEQQEVAKAAREAAKAAKAAKAAREAAKAEENGS
jgi:hypothetical protein